MTDAAFWEQKLAHYGLAMSQIISSEVQVLPGYDGCTFQSHAFDRDLSGHWGKRARSKRTGLMASEIFTGFNRVPVRYKPRNVRPLWAFSDAQCRALLEYIYPAMHSLVASRRYAARMWYIIYCAYRVGRTDASIAGDLGVTVQNIEKALQKARERADELFEGGRPSAAGSPTRLERPGQPQATAAR